MHTKQTRRVPFLEGESVISGLPFESVRLITMTDSEIHLLLRGDKLLIVESSEPWQKERLINAIVDGVSENEARP